MRAFLIHLPLLVLAGLAAAGPLALAVGTVDAEGERDNRNERCARVAVAARSGRGIDQGDAALAACAAGSRVICERTREIVEDSPSTRGQNLLPPCSGPVQMAGGIGSAVAACKLALFALKCATGTLPVTPTIEDINTRPAVIRISPMPAGTISR